MITQYACNKRASLHLNVRISATKTRSTRSKFRMLHALCSASNPRAREKRRKTSGQADSQGHVSHYHEQLCLACQLLFLTGYHNLCKIEYPASGTLEQDKRRSYADVPFPRATKEIGDVCTQARIHVPLTENPIQCWNPGSTAWNPESKTLLDYITWGEVIVYIDPYYKRQLNATESLFKQKINYL